MMKKLLVSLFAALFALGHVAVSASPVSVPSNVVYSDDKKDEEKTEKKESEEKKEGEKKEKQDSEEKKDESKEEKKD